MLLFHVAVLLHAALLISLFCAPACAFHDCIEASTRIRQRHMVSANPPNRQYALAASPCSGGLCVGMKNGPHEAGNASYPVDWNGNEGTFVHSTMTVPAMPKKLDGITYYLWTDIFFGDASLGRMNQFVPQLLLGDVLDGSSGYPGYQPFWGHHDTWAFAAHYFFETWNATTNKTNAHAAYGELYPTQTGETLYTTFELANNNHNNHHRDHDNASTGTPPQWILTMGVVGDDSRVSRLVVDQPYMGMGTHWQEATTSWLEPSYKNMCINACWEIYGANDAAHLPSSGAQYNLTVAQPPDVDAYRFTSWEQDEGNGLCPRCKVTEAHQDTVQTVLIEIEVPPDDGNLESPS